jgi:CrcB protein
VDFLIVGVGGFFGAISRYAIYYVERTLEAHIFPVGTLLINLLGCLLAGLVMAWVERAAPIHRQLILMASVGFIGSFTTFSTFSVETLQLVRGQQMILALMNILLNTVLGLLLVWTGRALGLRF